ncbi:hypothetical protein GGX14DRAFT_630140 [Mycena pura]|uniref:C2H2-type domain-containing protein n=1 Tax=Mycena pura TaxID=153505 RepID=A0AAD6YSC3_9AGAR|nr:hypothetical protein GGX14DRAFT_630140 [Mycena pura]
MTEDYTPSIHIEPPPQAGSNEHAVYSSLGMFDSSYCPSSERAHPQPPALFIQPDSVNYATELSPLDEFWSADIRYSPSTSGRSSPIGAWSPASSLSGEVFPEDLNEDFSWAHQQALSAHSSPALSQSSLSPLTTAFDGFALEESYQTVERSVLNGPPAFSRLRSSSHSISSASPEEFWTEGVGRGRSASMSGANTSTDNTQFYPTDNTEAQFSVGVEATFSESLGTSMSWGSTSSGNAHDDNNSPLGSLVPGWTYPNHEGLSVESQDQAPPSPSLLAVPNGSLRRRGACSSRRSLSHSDLNSLMPPEQDVGRGRGQHRTTLSIPNSRSASSGSRASSRDVSPHGPVFFNDLQALGSYSPSAPPSPAFEDAATSEEAMSIARRRTFTAMRGSSELDLPSVPSLNRASSAPAKGRRSRPNVMPPGANLGVFKAEKTDMSSFLSSPGDDTAGSRQEFRVSQPPSNAFKAEVASKKIRQASNARRLNVAAFSCPLPTCSSTFTARHNLMNHINSHNKHRPHKCLCGMAFTTQGVLNRHKKRCSHK